MGQMPERKKIVDWLDAERLSNQQIVAYQLFGSFARNEKHFCDIDVLIVFSEWDQANFLQGLAKRFNQEFSIALHIQGFHITQTDAINMFLERAWR